MAQLINTLQTQDTIRSASRFLVVGALGTLVDLSIFAVLHVLLGAPALAANTISYSAGIVNNYFLHRNWTYARRSRKAASRQFTQFMGISLSALALNSLIVLLLSPSLGALFADPAHGAVLAKLCAIGVGMGWNFLANHLWTFRDASSG